MFCGYAECFSCIKILFKFLFYFFVFDHHKASLDTQGLAEKVELIWFSRSNGDGYIKIDTLTHKQEKYIFLKETKIPKFVVFITTDIEIVKQKLSLTKRKD